uniref:Uncharacterized protein n=1 Tax=Anopheles culicifacies TaxID=139723 RepID=A0A182MTD1_9DIPT
MSEIVQLEDDVEETEDNYETTMEDNLAEASSDYSVSYDVTNGKLEEDTSDVLYHEQNNVDGKADAEISLEQRYENEKRKSILLYELNEKLERDLQQHKAEIQENGDTIVSGEVEGTKETLSGTTLRESKILTFKKLPAKDAAGQCDPLYNPTGITASDNHSESFQFMTSSIKKMQSVIENIANQSERRYSGFGDFMVRELNEMDELTSMRLINEITSMLKKEGDVIRNSRDNAK